MATSRTYELKRRAERQEETRRQIVAAAVELHTTLGPSRTTVQGIAEKAGVTRPTVYAHFPDARSLLEACSGHVHVTVPPPDPTPWHSISNASERLETALRELYGYYERLEPLLENVERDAAVMPVVADLNGTSFDPLSNSEGVVVRLRSAPVLPSRTTTDGAFMEQSGRNQWQSVANGKRPKTAQSGENRCRRLRPVAVTPKW